MTIDRPCRSWCKFCVMGRGVNAPHKRSDTQEDLEGVPHVSMDCGFLGDRKRASVPCAGHPRTETQDDVGKACSEKRNGVLLDRRQRQWLSPSKGRRSRHAQRTPEESLSRRDGTRTRYFEHEPFRGPWMAVTMHLTFRSEWRDPQR